MPEDNPEFKLTEAEPSELEDGQPIPLPEWTNKDASVDINKRNYNYSR